MSLDTTATAADTVGAAADQPVRRRSSWRVRSRWLVHLALLASVAAAIATLQLLHVRVAYHAVVGLVFGGLVVIHLIQRRHRIARMVARLGRARPRIERELRLLASDTILALLTLNVVISGIVDWNRGTQTKLPLPDPFGRWHGMSSIVLVVYLIVHVSRRWRRIRRSTIR
jgi:hypothetical protein